MRDHKHHLREFLARTARRARLRRPTELAFHLLLLLEGAIITAAIDDDPGVPARTKAAAVLLDAAA